MKLLDFIEKNARFLSGLDKYAWGGFVSGEDNKVVVARMVKDGNTMTVELRKPSESFVAPEMVAARRWRGVLRDETVRELETRHWNLEIEDKPFAILKASQNEDSVVVQDIITNASYNRADCESLLLDVTSACARYYDAKTIELKSKDRLPVADNVSATAEDSKILDFDIHLTQDNYDRVLKIGRFDQSVTTAPAVRPVGLFPKCIVEMDKFGVFEGTGVKIYPLLSHYNRIKNKNAETTAEKDTDN